MILSHFLDLKDKKNNEQYVVSDLCMGTGTTGVSALQTYGTQFIGFEVDVTVFEVIFHLFIFFLF